MPCLVPGLAPALLALCLAPAASAEAPSAVLQIVASADGRAGLRACDCPGDPSRNVALRSHRFAAARATKEPVLIVDGGNWSPERGAPLESELNDLMLEVLPALHYDAVGVGDLEAARGPEFLIRAAQALPLVCANLRGLPEVGTAIPAYRLWEAGDLTVAVTGYLDPLLYYEHEVALTRSPESLLVVDPAEALAPLLEDLAPRADLVVILAHAPDASIAGHLEGLLTAKIAVVSGHPGEGARNATRLGPALQLFPGTEAREIAVAHVAPGSEGLEAVQQRAWDLKLGGKVDRRLEAVIAAFESEHGVTP